MAEIRRGSEGLAGGERLPWLEPVEDEDDYEEEAGGYGGMLAAAAAVLVGIALITAGIMWYRHHRAATADLGQIIRADPAPYKIRAPEPGGLRPDAVGDVAAGTSAGQDIDGLLDPNGMPEQPVTGPGSHPADAQPPPQQPGPALAVPPPAPQATPAAKPPLAGAPAAPTAPVVGTGIVQLGAFKTEAKATAAGKSLARRFAYLRDLTMTVVPVQSGEDTLYRLRASGVVSSAQTCAKLQVAGETCVVIAG